MPLAQRVAALRGLDTKVILAVKRTARLASAPIIEDAARQVGALAAALKAPRENDLDAQALTQTIVALIAISDTCYDGLRNARPIRGVAAPLDGLQRFQIGLKRICAQLESIQEAGFPSKLLFQERNYELLMQKEDEVTKMTLRWLMELAAFNLWHWEYFQTRRQLLPNSSTSKDYHGNNKYFLNTWCRACIADYLQTTQLRDTRGSGEDTHTNVRSPEQLLRQALAVISPVSGRREGFEAHIRACKVIDPQVKARLVRESAASQRRSCLGSAWSNWEQGSDSDSSSSGAHPFTPTVLSKDQQKLFESDLCKMWVANGFPWQAVNHPQTRIFFRNWFSAAKLPNRRKLSGRILQDEVRATNESMRNAIQGRVATGMSDGWKNIKRDSLIASMLSVDYKTYTVKVHDVSAERKTAENHLKLVLSDIDFAENEHNTRVIAWVSDAGGDSRAMRVRLHRLRPHILVFDCWAHQINLVVGDILNLTTGLVDVAAGAIEIIKWLLNHSYLLGLLRQEQLRCSGKIRSLSLPSITRWTAHYLSFTSLLSESGPIRSLVALIPDAFRATAGRSPEKIEQVERIMARIEDPGFWQKLSELKLYLEPFAIAANVSQAPTTRLDHILVELGRLYHTFSKYAFNPNIRECVLESLERRWAKADQDPFILAVFLNPFIRARLFNLQNRSLNRSALYGVVKRVFRRVFRKDNDLELYDAFMDYHDSRNEFHPDQWDYEELRSMYERSGKSLNLVHVWSGLLALKTPNSGRHQLAHLAIHILSIVANSAGCERLFSEMGNIHTKRRNRLAYNKVFDTAVVRMDLKRKHAAEGLTRSRLKRQFGSPASDLALTAGSIPGDQHDEAAEEMAEVDMTAEEPAAFDLTTLAAQLRQDVLDDEDPTDDEAPVYQCASGPAPRRVRLFFGTQVPIELKDIFDYERAESDEEGLGFFKQAGLANLQKEREIYNLATQEMQEEVDPDSETE